MQATLEADKHTSKLVDISVQNTAKGLTFLVLLQ